LEVFVPILKSSEKDVRRTKRRRERNLAVQTRLKTVLSKVRKAKTKDEAKAAYKAAESLIDKASVKGHLHKNNAARKKSRLLAGISKMA